MKYRGVEKASFLERPNRFIAYVEGISGQEEKRETVHVKNTGRCRELLLPQAQVYVQHVESPNRKTKWDLIAVEKDGQIINMDSQVPNKVVEEWIRAGNLFPDVVKIKSEYQYGKSRIDFYVETRMKKVLIEVKGVTLKEGEVARFPDAPSDRAVKHLEELMRAVDEGYEAYVFFVIQMKGVCKVLPNVDTHPEFAKALWKARERGVHLIARDCIVTSDEIRIDREIPVRFPKEMESIDQEERLRSIPSPLISWYQREKRDLPWRKDASAYHVWVSEIMLQQTRVEAVKPFYRRFLDAFPRIQDLADAPEEKLLKMWEGLGYYNRVRNMQKAARQIVERYGGEMPEDYEKIRDLSGIGSYTAGAICSIAFGIPKPAVDGNVLRVLTRILADDEDIMKLSVRKKMEKLLEEIIPKDAASDFNQGLIELGAIVCVPNGVPKCSMCPLSEYCLAHQYGTEISFPVKKKAKARRKEEKTVFILKDGERIALHKRSSSGLLAGLYEFPNTKGKMEQEEALRYVNGLGMSPIRIQSIGEAKHIFSHVEWHMTGYMIRVDELERTNSKDLIFVHPDEIQKEYPIPAAFEAFTNQIGILIGQDKYEQKI